MTAALEALRGLQIELANEQPDGWLNERIHTAKEKILREAYERVELAEICSTEAI